MLDLIGEHVHLRAPFLPPEGKLLPTSALGAGVLCTRHNSALAPLDTVAKRLFEFLLRRTEEEVVFVAGTDIERWMLKAQSGLAATGGAISPRGLAVTLLEPQRSALDVLFGDGLLPAGFGLYVPVRGGRVMPAACSFNVLAADTSGHAAGFALTVQYVEFLFALAPLPAQLDDGTSLHYRPESLGLTVGDSYREVHFGWRDGGFLALTNPGP